MHGVAVEAEGLQPEDGSEVALPLARPAYIPILHRHLLRKMLARIHTLSCITSLNHRHQIVPLFLPAGINKEKLEASQYHTGNVYTLQHGNDSRPAMRILLYMAKH